MVDASITGADQLQKLGVRFKQASNGDLRKELLAGIRGVVKSRLIPAVRQGAEDRLPRGGGLASAVAGQKFAARTSLASGKVSIVGANGMKSLEDIDRGRVRHPVFGNRGAWTQQQVTPGFFSGPIESRLPEVRDEITHVMSDVAKKLGRPL